GLLEKSAAAVGIGAVRGHLLQVVPAREQLARRGDDDDSNRSVTGRRVECRLKRLHELDRQSVRWRVVQRQAKDWAFAFYGEERCHGRRSLRPGLGRVNILSGIAHARNRRRTYRV